MFNFLLLQTPRLSRAPRRFEAKLAFLLASRRQFLPLRCPRSFPRVRHRLSQSHFSDGSKGPADLLFLRSGSDYRHYPFCQYRRKQHRWLSFLHSGQRMIVTAPATSDRLRSCCPVFESRRASASPCIHHSHDASEFRRRRRSLSSRRSTTNGKRFRRRSVHP